MNYIGTKLVEAEPARRYLMPEGTAIIVPYSRELTAMEAKRLQRATAGEDGYKVRYADGYVSWSPKNVFEEAYRPIDGMSFGLAIEAMKKGKKCRRAGWNGKNQHIELATRISYVSPDGVVVNVEHDAIGNKAIAFCGTSGIQMGWLASQADMLADDWEIVED